MTWSLDQPLPRLTDLDRFNRHVRTCSECSPPVNLCPRGRHLDDQAAASFVSALGGEIAELVPAPSATPGEGPRARTDHWFDRAIVGMFAWGLLLWAVLFVLIWLIAQVRSV